MICYQCNKESHSLPNKFKKEVIRLTRFAFHKFPYLNYDSKCLPIPSKMDRLEVVSAAHPTVISSSFHGSARRVDELSRLNPSDYDNQLMHSSKSAIALSPQQLTLEPRLLHKLRLCILLISVKFYCVLIWTSVEVNSIINR